MLSMIRSLLGRVKALFITDIALDFEAELATREAERRAELHRQADRYQQEGLHGIAQMLRQRAENLDSQRPLHSILPAIQHLECDQLPAASDTPLLLDCSNGNNDNPVETTTPTTPNTPKKRGGKR